MVMTAHQGLFCGSVHTLRILCVVFVDAQLITVVTMEGVPLLMVHARVLPIGQAQSATKHFSLVKRLHLLILLLLSLHLKTCHPHFQVVVLLHLDMFISHHR